MAPFVVTISALSLYSVSLISWHWYDLFHCAKASRFAFWKVLISLSNLPICNARAKRESGSAIIASLSLVPLSWSGLLDKASALFVVPGIWRSSRSKCYELMPLVPFLDCWLGLPTDYCMTHRTALSLSRGLTPWNSITVSPRAMPRPVLLSHSVLLSCPMLLSHPVLLSRPMLLSRPILLPHPDH